MPDYTFLLDQLNNKNIEFEINQPMSKLTSFRVGRCADVVIFPKTMEEISFVVSALKTKELKYYILGKGTNLLFKDTGDSFAIICLNKFKGLELSGQTITANAGESLASFCSLALDNSLSGAEFAWGIPGSIGGAIYMNAGAFGGEVKDIIKTVTAINNQGEIVSLSYEELALGYRKSIFQNDEFVILSGSFELSLGDKSQIKSKMDEILSKRKAKQPLDYPSAGSTFKRPDGAFAAELIDRCKLKGYRLGGAMVSEKHAGFVINYDNATATDILNLIDYIKETVKEATGYRLECEVKIL